jgi:hypothetical protein
MSLLDGAIRDGRHHMQIRVYYEDTDFSALTLSAHATYPVNRRSEGIYSPSFRMHPRWSFICRKLDITRGEAVALAKELDAAGCGEFKNGRRGAKSRLDWNYNCIGLGKAAAGEPVTLERTDVLDMSDFEEDDDIDAKHPSSITEMIADAKRDLAARSGLLISQIEIQIKV